MQNIKPIIPPKDVGQYKEIMSQINAAAVNAYRIPSAHLIKPINGGYVDKSK